MEVTANKLASHAWWWQSLFCTFCLSFCRDLGFVFALETLLGNGIEIVPYVPYVPYEPYVRFLFFPVGFSSLLLSFSLVQLRS